jgi:polar amino acid transport system substrate-binding protein
MSIVRIALVGLCAAAVVGCGIPRDIAHTTAEARSRGHVRAGAVAGAATIEIAADGRPAGPEVDAIAAFAASLDLEVRWEIAAEHDLMRLLGRRQLDVVVGGVEASSPYARLLGMSAPLAAAADGELLVAAVPSGENRWLLRLNRFLDERWAG